MDNYEAIRIVYAMANDLYTMEKLSGFDDDIPDLQTETALCKVKELLDGVEYEVAE